MHRRQKLLNFQDRYTMSKIVLIFLKNIFTTEVMLIYTQFPLQNSQLCFCFVKLQRKLSILCQKQISKDDFAQFRKLFISALCCRVLMDSRLDGFYRVWKKIINDLCICILRNFGQLTLIYTIEEKTDNKWPSLLLLC